MLGAVGHKCLACAFGRIKHFIPFIRIVERAEHNAANDFKIVFEKFLPQDFRLFGHITDGAKLDAFVTGSGALLQHGLPCRVGWIRGKFDAPGTWRVADADSHVGPFQKSETVCHDLVSEDASAAATI